MHQLWECVPRVSDRVDHSSLLLVGIWIVSSPHVPQRIPCRTNTTASARCRPGCETGA